MEANHTVGDPNVTVSSNYDAATLYIMALVYLAIIVVAAFVGILQNFLILILYCRKSKLVLQHRKWFMVFLAVADVMITLVPFAFAPLLIYTNVGGGIILKNAFFSLITVEAWTLCAIVVDRFISVAFPMKHRLWCPGKRVLPIALFLWVLAFLLHMFWKGYLICVQTIQLCASVILPCIANAGMYIYVQKKVTDVRFRRLGKKSWGGHEKNAARTIGHLLAAKKSIMLCMISVLLLSIGPCLIAVTILMGGCRTQMADSFKFHGPMLGATVTFLAMVIHPWIHTIRHKDMCMICCCRRCRKRRSHNAPATRTTGTTMLTSKDDKQANDERTIIMNTRV